MSSELLACHSISESAVPVVFAGSATAERRFLEFFITQLNNDGTRRCYLNVVRHFAAWCDSRNIVELRRVEPMHIASYLKALERDGRSAPSIKLHLTALRGLFNWLIMGQVIGVNPAQSVRGPKHVVTKGKTPVLTSEEARRLMDSIRVLVKVKGRNGAESQAAATIGLRDRAFIAVMVYTFARVAAVLRLKVRDYFSQGGSKWLRLHEKAGKVFAIPCHHNLQQYLDEYISTTGIGADPDGLLFRTTGRKTGEQHAMWQQDAYRMIQRHARDAGIMTKIGNHTFRASGITIYLKGGGRLEVAQKMAGHSSAQTTELYDRRHDEVTLDEVERIAI